jgi:hypothetical protein
MSRNSLVVVLFASAVLLACAGGSAPKRSASPTASATPQPAPARKGTLPPSPSKGEVDRRFEAKLTQLRESARALGQPLALYPEDLRAAILEVARDPALIPRLADVARNGGKGLDAVIAGEPAPVADAARKLVREPRLLELLERHLLVVGLIGALYEDDPSGVRALLDQRAHELAADEGTVVDDWRKRVEADPDARAQLVAAQDAYEDATGEDGGQAAGASQSGTTTVIYAEPSYSFTTWVYGSCDLYWALCGSMYGHWIYWDDYYEDYWDDYWDEREEAREDWQQWLEENRDEIERPEQRQQRRDERRQQRDAKREQLREKYGDRAGRLEQPGNGGMGQAISDWKGRNADSLPADLLRVDGKLNERFKSYGEADRAFRDAVRSGSARPADRSQAVRARTESSIAQRPAGTRGGERNLAGALDAPPTARADGGKLPEGWHMPRPAPTQIDRGTLSRPQQIDRALSTNNAGWSRSGLPGQTRGGYGVGGGSYGGRYGGGALGGGMRGGGGRGGGGRGRR